MALLLYDDEMATNFIENADRYGYDFISGEYLPADSDEYYLRNEQLNAFYPGANARSASFRHLAKNEIKQLVRNRNVCANWNDFLVSDNFNPDLFRDNFFAGLVRIGRMSGGLLRYHDYVLPVGISGSRIISCDIGDRCAIHGCRYASHYIVGDDSILSNIDELDTTNHAKFGEGIVKDGEDEAVRVWLDPLNEAGGRGVLPFYDMNCADAYLWLMHRSDEKLMAAFKRITQDSVSSKRGYYGIIGHNAVIKHCHIIKDVRFGDCVYIKGANKLKNLTIKSDKKEPTQIGEGVELVNGIIGYGCRVFYGCKAVRFVLGNNCALKYGARLIHSILGDNSTVSCCEVLNNLVFPAHEQHHNNSFLIASMVMGQSNLAAGATVGSNHNSRGNDGEIIAGRGFWPGLSSAIKHNSRFASYTLIAKGLYPVELNIPFPFCLLTTDIENSHRVVMPAYWWMHNMYALERNTWKYKARDNRAYCSQRYETEYMAPDTVQEIINALNLLNLWANNADSYDRVLVPGRFLERSDQPVRVVKVKRSSEAYREMLCYYAVKTLCEYFSSNEQTIEQTTKQTFEIFQTAHPKTVSYNWENMGGQLVPAEKAHALRSAIENGSLCSWQAIHGEYDKLAAAYPLDKALNALQVLRYLAYPESQDQALISGERWGQFLDEALRIRLHIEDQVFKTKLKDYNDTFRNCTYSNKKERDAVLGKLDENKFILAARQAGDEFRTLVEQWR